MGGIIRTASDIARHKANACSKRVRRVFREIHSDVREGVADRYPPFAAIEGVGSIDTPEGSGLVRTHGSHFR